MVKKQTETSESKSITVNFLHVFFNQSLALKSQTSIKSATYYYFYLLAGFLIFNQLRLPSLNLL